VAFAEQGGESATRHVAVSFAQDGGVSVQRGVSVLFQNAQEVAATNSGVTLAFRTAAPLFTDDPLVPRLTVIRVIHLTELRAQIDDLRGRSGLPAFDWTDASVTARTLPVRAGHIVELRSALNAVYVAAGWSLPVYSVSSIAASDVVTAAHVTEIRAAVARIW